MVPVDRACATLPRSLSPCADLLHVEGWRAGACSGSGSYLDGGGCGTGAPGHSARLRSCGCGQFGSRRDGLSLVSCNRVTREQILASLCMLSTSYLVDRPRGTRVGSKHSPNCVRGDGGGSVLPDHSALSVRDTATSLSAPNARQRSALENLVATVAPERAEKISEQLISEFGSLGRVLAQTCDAQARVLGDDRLVISLLGAARAAMEVSLQTEFRGAAISAADPKLIRYLLLTMGSLGEETLRVFYLDHASRLLAEEQVAAGSVNKLEMYPRAIFKRALEKDSSQLLLVHNHPAGSSKPSAQDIAVTSTLVALGRSLDVAISDHIIVAGTRWTSMRAGGFL